MRLFFLITGMLLLITLMFGGWIISAGSTSPAIMFLGALLFGWLFLLIYRLRSYIVLIGAIFSVVLFVTTQVYFIYEQSFGTQEARSLIPFILLLLGFVFVHISKHSINLTNNFAYIYKVIGTVIVAVSLYTMSLEFFAQGFSQIREYKFSTGPLWILYILTALLGSFIISSRGESFKVMVRENSPWLLLDAMVFIILLIPMKWFALLITINLFGALWAIDLVRVGFSTRNRFYIIIGLQVITVITATLLYKL